MQAYLQNRQTRSYIFHPYRLNSLLNNFYIEKQNWMRQIDKRVFSNNKVLLSIKLSLWYYIKTGCLKSNSPEIISSCSKIVNKGKNFNSRIGEKEYNRPRERVFTTCTKELYITVRSMTFQCSVFIGMSFVWMSIWLLFRSFNQF